jgi:hypothetical protein
MPSMPMNTNRYAILYKTAQLALYHPQIQTRVEQTHAILIIGIAALVSSDQRSVVPGKVSCAYQQRASRR